MAWKPPSSVFWHAVEIYLRHAYNGQPPSAILARMQTLHSLSDADFYSSSVFERENAREPTRIAVRLGNQRYPHMKLAIHRAPGGHGYLFRADTHDAHCRPDPSSHELRAFQELMQHNATVASAIETDWAENSLPTFKTFLREDLERRQKS